MAVRLVCETAEMPTAWEELSSQQVHLV